jgi:hypothetical protein
MGVRRWPWLVVAFIVGCVAVALLSSAARSAARASSTAMATAWLACVPGTTEPDPVYADPSAFPSSVLHGSPVAENGLDPPAVALRAFLAVSLAEFGGVRPRRRGGAAVVFSEVNPGDVAASVASPGDVAASVASAGNIEAFVPPSEWDSRLWSLFDLRPRGWGRGESHGKWQSALVVLGA